MIATGIVLLSMGIPCIALGLYYRKNPPEGPKGLKNPKSKKGGKKGRKSQKAQKSKEEEKPKPQSGGLSLIVGGLGFTVIGIGFMVAHFMK